MTAHEWANTFLGAGFGLAAVVLVVYEGVRQIVKGPMK
jgi:hypothetical protein